MDDLNTYMRLALAFGIGLAIGIERGWHLRDVPSGERSAGVRTFTLIGLFGGILGLVGLVSSDSIVAVGVLGFFSLIAAAYFGGLKINPDRGFTTEVAALTTFALGLLAMRGDMMVAAAAAVVVVAVLDLKDRSHDWIAKIDSAEITGVIKLLVISVVVLPLLPDQGYGPGGLLNPYAIWWTVVVIAGLSFAAYAAIKVAGPRGGVLLTGVLGGLASSTAVTLNFARMAARTPKLNNTFGAGIALASTVMLLRALVIVFIFNAAAARVLVFPLIMAAVGSLSAAYLLFMRKQPSSGADHLTADKLGAPTDLGTAFKFGFALVVISIAVHYGKEWLGAGGLVAVSGAAGLVDIDAAAITVARLGGAGIGGDV